MITKKAPRPAHCVLAALTLAGSSSAQADFDTAGRVLRSLAYGPTPELLYDLAEPGSNNYDYNDWIVDQLDNNPAVLTESPEFTALLTELLNGKLPGSLTDPYGDPGDFDCQLLGDDSCRRSLAVHQVLRALYSSRQLQERMTQFWDNHFTTKASTIPSGMADMPNARWVEHRENQEFRENALGTFKDLLRSSITSPTMLIYLNANRSFFNNLNENLAREILELHTLGLTEGQTDSGGFEVYDAQDIIDFAKILTGWTVSLGSTWDPANPVGDRPLDTLDSCEVDAYAAHGDVNRNGRIDLDDVNTISAGTSGAYDPDLDIWPNNGNYLDCNATPGDGVVDQNDVNEANSRYLAGEIEWIYDFQFHLFAPGNPNLQLHDTDQYEGNVSLGGGISTQGLMLFKDYAPLSLLIENPAFPQNQGAPGTLAAPSEYLDIGYQVLDHLAASDLTADFICRKLYAYFISDEDPPQAVINAMKGVWGPEGDIKAVLEELFIGQGVLPAEFQKVSDSYEAMLRTVRAFDGQAEDGFGQPSMVAVEEFTSWLEFFLGYRLFEYPSPEGRPESGEELLGTSSLLGWTVFNQHIWGPPDPNGPGEPVFPSFRYDLEALATSFGVNIASAGDMVEFFFNLQFQGNWSAAERQLALTFLTTLPNGVSWNYAPGFTARVNKLAAYVASLPQSLQQ